MAVVIPAGAECVRGSVSERQSGAGVDGRRFGAGSGACCQRSSIIGAAPHPAMAGTRLLFLCTEC